MTLESVGSTVPWLWCHSALPHNVCVFIPALCPFSVSVVSWVVSKDSGPGLAASSVDQVLAGPQDESLSPFVPAIVTYFHEPLPSTGLLSRDLHGDHVSREILFEQEDSSDPQKPQPGPPTPKGCKSAVTCSSKAKFKQHEAWVTHWSQHRPQRGRDVCGAAVQ